MTLAIPFFQALKALFTGKAAEAPAPAASLSIAPACRQESIKLQRMLVVTALRANGNSCQLMATELGESMVMFRASVPVEQGELLGIELLLPGLGPIKATATVEWILCSQRSYSGQLTVWTTPEQRQTLAEFARRQREGRR